MAYHPIKTPHATKVTLTTPSGMGGLTPGSAVQFAMIDNTNDYPAAIIYARPKTGASAPTADKTYDIFLIRKNGTHADDGAADAAGAITIMNAIKIGYVRVGAAANTVYKASMDTSHAGPLGPSWTIAVMNATDQNANATAGDHVFEYAYYNNEVR